MRASAPASISWNSWRAAVFALAVAAYATTLLARGWVRDDRWLIADNPLFSAGWTAAPAVVSTGYVQAARGAAAPISEYRPLLSLSFLGQLATTGRRPAPLHAVNALLHALVCLLLLECFRRRLAPAAAAAGALLFAVMPVHAEAVSYLTSRSELLAAAALCGSWLLLDGPRPRLLGGLACFAAGLLSKESAVLIPLFLALSDWTFDGVLPWSPSRRRVYAGLLAVLAGCAAARAAVLGARVSAGAPFFASRWDAAWAWPAFALRHYAWTALTGAGLCADFTRAGGPATAAPTVGGALALAVLILGGGAAAWGLARRRRWAFWLAAPLLFLLPTCPLLVPLDTLGAERFLYIPTIALAAGLGALFERGRRARPALAWGALAALGLWYAGALAVRNGSWRSETAYFRAACGCNPSSARAHGGLGAALLEEGQDDEGRAELERASVLDPALAQPRYDLAALAWKRGDAAEALRRAGEAVARDPGSADSLVLLALAQDAEGQRASAVEALGRAERLLPWSPVVQYNLGRMLLLEGRTGEALPHARLYARLAPGDPDGAKLLALAEGQR